MQGERPARPGSSSARPEPPIVCFAAGTRIATPTGEAAIETLRPGDPVLAFDLREQRVVPSRVTAVQAHAGRLAGRLVAGGRTLHLTSEHPIFLPARGTFVPAREVPAGSALLALGAGGTARTPLTGAFAVPAGEAPRTVYDLTVDEQHDYFAEGILVHNKQPPPIIPACPAEPTTPVDRAEAVARLGRWLWNDDGSAALPVAERLGFDGTGASVEALVDELLNDPRAAAGFQAFLQSWLALAESSPSELVPAPLWSSFREETRRFLWHVLMEQNGGSAQMYQADFTFVDERLAAHYGLPLVADWTKVSVDPDRRGGLLAQGALLVGQRSAPARGRYIFERYHDCQAFPVVPTTHVGSEPRTPARSALSAAVPDVCKGCHHLLDGPGWTLQNYDELARYRTVDSDGAPVDSSGWLVTAEHSEGLRLAGRRDLAAALAASPEANDCLLLQVVRHAQARAGITVPMTALPSCFRKLGSPGQGFRELLHGVARTLILDWPRPDGGP